MECMQLEGVYTDSRRNGRAASATSPAITQNVLRLAVMIFVR